MKNSLTSDITIELEGQEYTLRSSLKAASAISSHFGGFIGAYQQLANGNLQACQYIIRQGIPASETRNISTEELNGMVYRSGIVKLSGPLSRYISRLQNGGRDPDEEDEPRAGEDDDSGNGEL
ncbi:hypothetical protein [Mesorhizobium sp. CAU 1741]|uniref:hypothetical protein n=1 Tax=Mesorhizobium sp. CAU 1741 TaxID=3140366 RepID=UPI00325BAAD5